ncbi:MAG: nucleotidyltransferase domain-containing protein [Candidatus Heimdallarchaeota archaeon]
MDEKLARILEPVKNYLLEIYGQKVKEILLYGSQARREPTKDSDIDLLVVVSDELDRITVRKSLSDILWEILMEKDELISVIVVPESFYNNYQSPFILMVKEEGISIV